MAEGQVWTGAKVNCGQGGVACMYTYKARFIQLMPDQSRGLPHFRIERRWSGELPYFVPPLSGVQSNHSAVFRRMMNKYSINGKITWGYTALFGLPLRSCNHSQD